MKIKLNSAKTKVQAMASLTIEVVLLWNTNP